MTEVAKQLKEEMTVEQIEDLIEERIENIWREVEGNEALFHQAIINRIEYSITHYKTYK